MDWLFRKRVLWPVMAVLAPGIFLQIAYRTGKVWQILDEPILPLIGIIAAVLVVVALLAMRKAEDGQEISTIFIIVVGGGGMFSLISVLGYLVFFNAQLDNTGVSRTHQVKIVEVVRERGMKWTVEVESWRQPGGTEEIWVPSELVKQGKEVVVTTREGFFGFEWISDVDRAP